MLVVYVVEDVENGDNCAWSWVLELGPCVGCECNGWEVVERSLKVK